MTRTIHFIFICYISALILDMTLSDDDWMDEMNFVVCVCVCVCVWVLMTAVIAVVCLFSGS